MIHIETHKISIKLLAIYTKLNKTNFLQLTPLIILKCTLDLEIKVLSSVSFAILCMIKYNALHRNIEIVSSYLTEYSLNRINLSIKKFLLHKVFL